MPDVKPVVMVKGMKRIRLPSLNIPIKIRKIPAMMVARASPLIPFLATMPATIVAKAAVGPEICTLLPPRAAIRKPATIAV